MPVPVPVRAGDVVVEMLSKVHHTAHRMAHHLALAQVVAWEAAEADGTLAAMVMASTFRTEAEKAKVYMCMRQIHIAP